MSLVGTRPMLNPRPFMSKRRGKRFLDCIDKDIGVRPH